MLTILTDGFARYVCHPENVETYLARTRNRFPAATITILNQDTREEVPA